ncbi:MAG TPA: choice-of-anchor tandem repeat GloVer-containing protein [Candidatus Aquilonibacter sp.]|jgi:uncharacterized repeat protein (TIGR03803 family)|nr:choice-of-anchor tandem repeat GloVer-containing protein [Candidatus Aquilonibacter sp.]
MNADSRRLYRLLSVALAILVLTVSSAAQTNFKVIHTFKGTGDGYGPWGQLLHDSQGNLYGTTINGGAYNYGSVFELTPPAGIGPWTESILYSFNGSSADLQGPQSGLVMDTAGNLYGTTFWGGVKNQGTVFELSPPAISGGIWSEATLFQFEGRRGNGAGGLVMSPSGVLYGTTLWGENVYELKPVPGATAQFKNLFIFNDGTNGFEPEYEGGALVADKNGNLYGTTVFGGANGEGEVFELSPPATKGAPWTETVLYSFGAYSTDAAVCDGGVVFDKVGNLYGATHSGGTYGYGAVFELSPPASTGLPWTETLLYSFNQAAGDGVNPYAGVVVDASGNIYGVTYLAGAFGGGTVFEISPSGGGVWTETVLHSFNGKTDGENPYGGLMISNGNHLFGVTSTGGVKGAGTVFEVIP